MDGIDCVYLIGIVLGESVSKSSRCTDDEHVAFVVLASHSDVVGLGAEQ